jgi:hypothetical protein
MSGPAQEPPAKRLLRCRPQGDPFSQTTAGVLKWVTDTEKVNKRAQG